MVLDPETGKHIGFESILIGGNVLSNFIPAIEKVPFIFISDAYPNLSFQGFHEALEKGSLSGNVVTGCRMVVTDEAFRLASIGVLSVRFTELPILSF